MDKNVMFVFIDSVPYLYYRIKLIFIPIKFSNLAF